MSLDVEYSRPVPHPDQLSARWYEATQRHELPLQRCTKCGAYMAPIKPRCVVCFAPAPEWVEACGQGTLYTFTVVHQPYPGFADRIPYNIAVVELDEGVRVTADVVDCPNDALQIGMALEVVFDDISDQVTLPRFRPVA